MSLNQYSQFAQKMIGLNRQIFRLNNVRTFFLSVSNTSPNGSEPINWKPIISKKTKTKGRPYKMTSAGDNVRVMIVKNELLKSTFCSIRVGVGSDDDPDHCQGIAHLLEHLICRTYEKKVPNNMGYYCQTMNFETKFTFTVPNNYAPFIRAWTNIMFSRSKIENEGIMEKERDIVDNEYQEKRNEVGFIDERTVEILKQKKDITLSKFGWGNLKTFSPFNDDELMEELEKLRKSYRRRPLNVCVYSPKEIEMSEVKNWLDIEGFITKEQRQEAEPNWAKRLKGLEAQHFIVLHSANDSIQLNIIYPFHKKLSLAEEDTLKIVGDLITKKFEGQLKQGLFAKKMATGCTGSAVMEINSFVVAIRLTADGLKHIQQVTSMVHDYFQFLRHNWQDINKQPLIDFNRETIDEQSDLDYADSVARCLGRVNDPFDEEDLFRPLTSAADVQKLIVEQILNNNCIRHTIAARDVDGVCAANAALVAKGTVEKEDIIGTQFHCLETGLFAEPSNTRTSYTLPQFDITELEKKEEKKEELEEEEKGKDLPVYIINPEDEAFMALYYHYLELKTAHLVLRHSHNLIKKEDYGIFRNLDGSISLLFDRENTKKYSDNFHPETEIDFKYYKQCLMEEYSLIMTDSKKLAKSLMVTALENLISNIKCDSVPLQYNVLKDMDFSKYKEHFEELNSENEIKHEELSEEFNEEFVIESINVDESSTVTLAFLQPPEGTDLDRLQTLVMHLNDVLRIEFPNLYTCTCESDTFGAADGILLTLLSVEEKKHQAGAEILKLLEAKMKQLELEPIDKHHPEPEQNKDRRNLWTEMRKRQIIIQIVGHVNGGYPSGPFQTHFKQWLEDHEEQFENISKL